MTRVSWAAAVLLLCGCALTGKHPPVEVHWYTPELVQPVVATPRPERPAVRLGTVRSGPELAERIAFSDGAWRMDFYEHRRWTQRPAHFVTDALERALFESQRFQPATATAMDGAQLDVEVVSFQELLSAKAHAGRVALRVRLTCERVLLDATIVKDVPVTGQRFEDVVAAISVAMSSAAEEVAQRVDTALGAAPPAVGGSGSPESPDR